ncbi:MAG: hypothetical protein HXY40_00830 [Chloroflexi bacterium]|nr:hypothetical protein [Chloroflexota bacterium]
MKRWNTPAFINLLMSIVGIAAVGLLAANLPLHDLTVLADEERLLAAFSTGGMNMLALLAACFGLSMALNYFVSALGKAANVPRLGPIMVFATGFLTVGGLVLGVSSAALQGIQTMLVMNTGTGLLFGSLIGWRIRRAQTAP